MRKVDLYWKSNPDWWEFVNHIPTIKESAPPEAQESYKKYMEQTTKEKQVTQGGNLI